MIIFGVLAKILRPLQAPWVEYVVGVLFLLTGFVLAILSNDPQWLNRFGALLVVWALVMAATTFRFQQEYEAFREHLHSYQIKIQGSDAEDITEINGGKSYYNLKFPEIALFSFVRIYEINLKQYVQCIQVTCHEKEGLMTFRILQEDFEQFCKMVLDTIKQELNSSFRAELRYAAVGTLVWAFGDLFIFWL